MSSTPQNIPGFIEGQYAEIPPDSYPQAISQGFKPGTVLTSPEGRKAVVPGDQAGKAVKENGFALGPPEQQPKTKMFSPAGDYAEVPNNAVQFGLKNGWKQAVDTTSPLGHSVPLPPDLAETAKKVGWGQGAPDTQPKPGFFASAVGSMMGINRDDIAKSRFDNSPLGQRAQAIQAQRLALNPRDTTDPRQDRLQAAKDLGIDPAHLQKLDELEAKAEKGVPWEDQLAEKFPVIGSQVRAAVKAVKPTKPGQPPVSDIERAGHGLAAALPFVGPMAEGSGEALGQGDVKSAVGQAAFAALPFLAHAAPEVAPRSEPTTTPTLTMGERAKTAGVRLLSGGNTGQERPLEPAAGPGTHAEVADYAASKGIDLTPAQATQSKPLKAIQAVGERAVVGGKPLQDVLTRQHGQVASAVSELQDRVGNPYTPDAETVGEHLQSQANEKLQALKDKAQADYQDFKEKTGGQGFDVDLSPVVDKYKTELQKQGEVLKNVPEQFAAPIRNMLEKLSSIKSDLPEPEANPVVRMDTAQQLRSYYLEIARDKSGNIPSRVNRLAAQAAQDIDEAMEKSAGPSADTWRRANSTWKQLQETYNDKASPLTKLISEPDPQKITSSLLAKGRFGGNSKTIRTLSQNGYDLSPLRHQVISDIASQNFKLTNGGNGLGGYQLPFLKELFEPQDLTELLHLGRVARATKFELNPSGTSNVLEALQQMSSVAKSKSPSLLGAGAGFALGGPVGAAIGAGGAEGLVPAAAARFSASPRNLQRALGRPVLEGRELERGSATPEDLDEALRAQFQKTSARDTDFSTQAKDQLFPDRTMEQLTPPELSQVMQRAQELKTTVPSTPAQVEKLQPVRGLGHYSPEDQAQVQALPEFLRQVEPRQLVPEEEKLAYGQARVSQLKQQLRETADPAEKEALQRQLDFVQNQRGSASPEEVERLPMLVAQGKARVTAEPLTNHVDQLNDWVDQFMAKGRLRDPESRAGAGVAMGLRDSRPDQLLVAHGPDDQPVGYAGLGKPEGNYLNLEHLVVRPDLLADDAKLKGVGTQLMRSAAEQAASQGKGLSLYPSKTAEGFYQKLGLTRLKGERTMVLSPENTQKLASQRGSGSMDDINKMLESQESNSLLPKGYSVSSNQQGSHYVINDQGKIAGGSFGKTPEEAITNWLKFNSKPTFYSKLEQVAQEKLPARFTGDQALATLRNAGVKADELAVVEPLLKGSTVLSKSAFMDEVRKNNLARSVQDVWKHGEDDASPPDAWVDNVGDMHQFISDYRDQQYNEDEAITKLVSEGWANDTAEAKELLADNASQLEDYARDEDVEIEHERQHSLGGPRYAEHQLPGGENYRELLLQLPERKMGTNPDYLKHRNDVDAEYENGDLTDKEYESELARLEQEKPTFTNSHWDEPNVLGHLRMNDRIDANGKKTLFLEELQSDWHQQGRRNGYREPTQKNPQKAQDAVMKFAVDHGSRFDDQGRWIEGLSVEDHAKYIQLLEDRDEAMRNERAVPDAPFKKDWHELLLKRALREAAEGGYDQLAWTPGDVQNERYDLSKHVDKISWSPDTNLLKAYDKQGNIVIDRGSVPPEKLQDYIGKEVAQRLLNEPTQKRTNGPGQIINVHELSGQDLKVGGQGMRGFYDKLVPDFLNRYGKRWGAKVGSTEIPTENENLYVQSSKEGWYITDGTSALDHKGKPSNTWDTRATFNTPEKAQQQLEKWQSKPLTVPVIQITPKMRQDILKGQPISDLMPPRQEGTQGLPMFKQPRNFTSETEARLPWA